MQNKSLDSLVQINTGFTFRKNTKKSGSPILLLQSKNIGRDIIISDKSLDIVSLDIKNLNAVAKYGDVIITARGSFRAAVVESKKTIIATSSVFILRLTTSDLNPKYLAILLNSPHAQKQMASLSTSGSISSLLKSQLAGISIPVPSLKKQYQAVELFLNIRKQKKLLQRKMHLISNIADGVLYQQITN